MRWSLGVLGLGALAMASCGGGGSSSPSSASIAGLDERPVSKTCVAPPREFAQQELGLKPLYPGVHVPGTVALVQAPGDDGHWYAAVQDGRVLRFDSNEAVTSFTQIGDFSGFIQGPDLNASIGLLGMAFHPRFAQNHQIFLTYTVADEDAPIGTAVVVGRFLANSDGTRIDIGSRRDLIAVGLRSHEHNGGTLAFGKDGFLYVGIGEGGPGEAPTDAAQRLDTLLGKVVRLDVDAADSRGYGIPSDNPYAGGGGLPEIWARGFRNPWKWSFDRDTGDLWLGDVGWHTREEVDRVERGGNYGWPVLEGTLCQRPPCDPDAFVAPTVELDHSRAAAITGGYVYRGSAVPELAGKYVYGDFVSGRIYTYAPGDPPSAIDLIIQSARAIGTFAQDTAGEIYVVDYATGDISRIVQGGDSKLSPVATTLSRSGCADLGEPSRPADGMMPYAVNMPLWSDGAAKSRWLSLPDDTTIGVADDGDWSFPVGTVLRKDFRLGDRLIESRLFVRHDDGAGRLDDGWAGYSYRWDEQQLDAVLVPNGQVESLPEGGTWTFPSGGDCLRCHTQAAGRTLGLTTRQLDRDLEYPGTGRTANQVETFEALKMVPRGTAAARADLADSSGGSAFPALDDETVSPGRRARAYLDANCSHCHRPGGPGVGSADYRASVNFTEMGICDVPPNNALGIQGARLLAPGNHAKSVLWVRMTATDARRMPPLATAVVDQAGADVIAEWIDSLAECPTP